MDELNIEALPENVRRLLIAQQDAAERNLREEIAKHDAAERNLREEIAEIRETQYHISIERFWERGFRDLELSRRQISRSTHTSTHANINNFEEKSFAILNINIEKHNLSKGSLFLQGLQNQENSSRISYFNESEIEHHVRHIVQDVLRCLDIYTLVSIHYQATLVSVVDTERRESKSDIWVVKTQSGVPIAVIEVKQPGTSKLSNLKVLGQVFDYMCNLRNSFGQCEVFGMVTTLDQWRVVWFPDTDGFAASAEMNPSSHEDLQEQFPVESILQRDLHGSVIYSWHSEYTLPMIGTAILKSMQSHYRAVSLLSSQRAYTVLRELDWHWGTITDVALAAHPALVLKLPQVAPAHLTVLRQFHGGADGQVCLALTEEFNLVVVKKFYEDELCEQEFHVWHEIYKVNVLRTRLLGSWCLLMPFVFHCVEPEEGKIGFDFNMSNWGRVPSSGLLNEDRFDAWTTKIKDFMDSSDITVEKALNDAVEKLAEKFHVHEDLEWRHVALLPVLSESGTEIEGMTSVLIDLARIKTVESVEDARGDMLTRQMSLLSLLK